MKLNRFQKWVARVCKIPPMFDVEKALRWQWINGDANGYKRGQKEPADCLHCPLYQQAQRTAPAAYEPPSPVTDPRVQARLEAGRQKRKADMMAFLDLEDSRELPKVLGDVARKFNTRKLSEL